MPPLREVVYSLYGAYRLALMDAQGMVFFNRTVDGCIRSFWAAAIVIPAYIVLVLMRVEGDSANISLVHFMTVEIIAYAISWTAYPLIMDDLARMLECSDRYPAFLVAYNWSSPLQMLVYLPAMALSESGLLVPALGDTVATMATIMVLLYQWFVTQTALKVSGFTAAGLVILDLVLSVFITGAADSML